MKLIMPSVFVISLLGCNKENMQIKKLNVPDSLIRSNQPNFKIGKIPENCYLNAIGKDSAALHIVDNLGTFTGKMAVKNNEKDSSFRDLSGFKNEDTLKLSYTITIEGISSENPIYFLQKDGELIEGIGDYNNLKGLNFDSKNSYKKVTCNQVTNLLK
jgi:hypothetical protein